MSNTVQPANPIYGTAAAPCPPPPVGNKKLVGYMTRLHEILLQLSNEKNKSQTLNRIMVLKKEVETTYQTSTGC